MVKKYIGRYRVYGANNHYVIGRWDGDSYQVMRSVPSYTTLKGALRKAKTLQLKDKKEGINITIPASKRN